MPKKRVFIQPTMKGIVSAFMCAGLLVVASAAEEVTYTYSLPSIDTVKQIYPDVSWLPKPYDKYYENSTLEQTIAEFTGDSLRRDGISVESVSASLDYANDRVLVTIVSDDSKAIHYEVTHPKFLENYAQALKGVAKCQETDDCWSHHEDDPNEPWAFFPQFGLPMTQQRTILMLNYPPASALTGKDYLNTFTMSRWTRLLEGVGVPNPTLFETIVDVRPIAAPGSGASQYLPNAQTYFNDPSGKTGGYYIDPQLNLMLNPAWNLGSEKTLPLMILGGPAREQWKVMTGLPDDILDTGVTTLPGASKPTPYILSNHPDVTTYQCCRGDTGNPKCTGFDLIQDEEIDVQVTCWAASMYDDPSQDPKDALAKCKDKWVDNRSAIDDLRFCALARTDSNECFDKGLTWDEALSYCGKNNNNPCTSYACPTGAGSTGSSLEVAD